MQTPADLLLPALLFMVIGIVIGVVAVLLIVDRTRARSEQKATAEEAPTPSPAALTAENPSLPADRFDNVANLFRERETGKLAVEVDQKAYLTPDTVPAQIRQDLLTLLEGLGAWLNASAAPVPPPIKSEPLPPPIAPTPAVSPRAETPTSTSIVAQINDILQEILLESPMADRKISLTQEPSMGVVVWVDGVKYSGIDTVPDPSVKELIKTAVRRWERKNDLSRRYP